MWTLGKHVLQIQVEVFHAVATTADMLTFAMSLMILLVLICSTKGNQLSVLLA